MWESMTYDNIMASMLDRINDDVDKREGSIIWDALSSAALELETAYLMMEYTLNQAFGDTADREYLIRRAAERGLSPEEATCSVIVGAFTPTSVDVSGKRFSLGGVNFVVGDAVTGETGSYYLTCETAGTEGNVAMGSLIPIDNVEGLETATATQLVTAGEDEEDTEVFRERYLESFATKAFGGNIADYKAKCLAIDGVGAVRVVPTWNGGGTVKCLILDDDLDVADATLISTVQNTIDPDQDGNGYGLAPIGHVVTVAAPTETTINAYFVLSYEDGYSWSDVESDITTMLNNYFAELREEWGDTYSGTNLIVKRSQVISRTIDITGVADISTLYLNSVSANVTLTNNAVPVLGEISHG